MNCCDLPLLHFLFELAALTAALIRWTPLHKLSEAREGMNIERATLLLQENMKRPRRQKMTLMGGCECNKTASIRGRTAEHIAKPNPYSTSFRQEQHNVPAQGSRSGGINPVYDNDPVTALSKKQTQRFMSHDGVVYDGEEGSQLYKRASETST